MMPMTARSADPRRPRLGRLGQDRDGDADEAVGAELQQHGGQDHRARGGRLGVGVGQPGVEREHRHLDAEAHEHAAEDQHRGAVGRGRRRAQAASAADVEGVAWPAGVLATGSTAPGSDTIISAEPNSVKRKNLIEAYWRCSPPHTPIMKYIGSRTTSKKTKNRMRSWATNVPIMPVSRMRIRMRNAFGLCGSGKWFHE